MNGLGALVLIGFGVSAGFGQSVNSVGMKLIDVPAGAFYMGSERNGEDRDEPPVHRVRMTRPFRVAATEVTNAQYQAFDPTHNKLRGKRGFSTADDEAVVFGSVWKPGTEYRID